FQRRSGIGPAAQRNRFSAAQRNRSSDAAEQVFSGAAEQVQRRSGTGSAAQRNRFSGAAEQVQRRSGTGSAAQRNRFSGAAEQVQRRSRTGPAAQQNRSAAQQNSSRGFASRTSSSITAKGKMPLPPDPLGEGATATAKLAFDAKTTKYETDFSLWEQADAAVIRVFITTTPVELVKSYRTFRSARDIWKYL
ncbi:unnamed protein product, partial [Closterium sp. NIES-54]